MGKTLFGVPQRSILGPIVFYTFLIDLFILEDVNIANYAIDNTLYSDSCNIDHVIISV